MNSQNETDEKELLQLLDDSPKQDLSQDDCIEYDRTQEEQSVETEIDDYKTKHTIIDEECKVETDLPKIDDEESGSYIFDKSFLKPDEAQELFEYLKKEIKWDQRTGTSANGEEYKEPRMTFWFGKPYTYSKVQWKADENWDPKLYDLKERLQKYADKDRSFNSVMCNYYVDGSHSIGWHADDENSLGQNPVIASISLGDTREFQVCRRDEYYNRQNCYEHYEGQLFKGCKVYYDFMLNMGSLLIMKGPMQDFWLHRVPKKFSKTKEPMLGRINLTFRYIVDDEEENNEKERKKKLRQKQREKQNRKLKEQMEHNASTHRRGGYNYRGGNNDQRGNRYNEKDNKRFDRKEENKGSYKNTGNFRGNQRGYHGRSGHYYPYDNYSYDNHRHDYYDNDYNYYHNNDYYYRKDRNQGSYSDNRRIKWDKSGDDQDNWRQKNRGNQGNDNYDNSNEASFNRRGGRNDRRGKNQQRHHGDRSNRQDYHDDRSNRQDYHDVRQEQMTNKQNQGEIRSRGKSRWNNEGNQRNKSSYVSGHDDERRVTDGLNLEAKDQDPADKYSGKMRSDNMP